MKLTMRFQPDLRGATTARFEREDGSLAWTANFGDGAPASERIELPMVAIGLAALAGIWGHSWALAAGVAAVGLAVAAAGRIWSSGGGRGVSVVSADGAAAFEVSPNGWRDNEFVVREHGHDVARIDAAAGAWNIENAEGKWILAGTWTTPSIATSSWESLPGAPKFTFAEAPLTLTGEDGNVTVSAMTAAGGELELDFDVPQSIGLGAAIAGVVRLRAALA